MPLRHRQRHPSVRSSTRPSHGHLWRRLSLLLGLVTTGCLGNVNEEREVDCRALVGHLVELQLDASDEAARRLGPDELEKHRSALTRAIEVSFIADCEQRPGAYAICVESARSTDDLAGCD